MVISHLLAGMILQVNLVWIGKTCPVIDSFSGRIGTLHDQTHPPAPAPFRKLLGYLNGAVVPYKRSQSMIKANILNILLFFFQVGCVLCPFFFGAQKFKKH